MRRNHKDLWSKPRTAALSAAFLLCVLSSNAISQVSGNVALTSDYVWRGSSQTQEDPAVQGAFKYAHASGFYASVWGSNVRFQPHNGASSEFDLAVGWAGKFAPNWAFDVYLMRYQYPSADIDLNWNELNAGLTWRDNYWLIVGYSDNALASDVEGTYVLLGARYPVMDSVRLEGTVAQYLLDETYAADYRHGSVSAIWAFSVPFELRLTVHGTDSAAKRLFPNMAGTRAEIALHASF